MKIVHVTTFTHGGAARACLSLHNALQESGISSHVLAFIARSKLPGTSLYPARTGVFEVDKYINRLICSLSRRRFESQIRGWDSSRDCFSSASSWVSLLKAPEVQSADSIHLHWVANFLDYSEFFHAVSKPVVWTLHDMAAFTGGCHYSFDCRGYLEGCVQCPVLQTSATPSVASGTFKRKSAALHNLKEFCYVTPSRWLHQIASKSQLFGEYQGTVIPYSVDLQAFHPMKQSQVREKLGIPDGKKVLFFAAGVTNQYRKGFDLLVQAVELLKHREDLFLIYAGESFELGSIQIPSLRVPYIRPQALLREYYSACDVVIVPSRADNLPNVALEATACGSPVISFAIGGLPEIIESGANGLIVEELSAPALAEGINSFLDAPKLDPGVIREMTVARYSHSLQAKRYGRLYEEFFQRL